MNGKDGARHRGAELHAGLIGGRAPFGRGWDKKFLRFKAAASPRSG
jgi:hypothetical protein